MAQPSDLSNVWQSNIGAMQNRYNAPATALNSVTQYLSGQQQKVQDLQMQQAQDLSKFKTLDQVYYGGAHQYQLDQLLSQNPYGKHLVTPKQNMGNAGQAPSPMPGNPNSGGAMIGAPGTSQFGAGVLPMPISGGGNAQSAPSGAPMSPMNPINSPVVTGGSTTQKAFEPPSFSQTYANPAAEANVAGAKEFSGKMAGEQAGAQAGVAKDTQQLAMITNAIKPLAENYDKVYNSKVGGVLPAAGDVYGSTIVKNADWLPRGIQNSVVPPETQQAAGQFLANKNELVTKLQPLLSQQFGKDGSSRIMESLLNMSQNEIGDLNTPRDQFHGQITGTISSLYRIAKASQAYKQDLDTSGQSSPNPTVAAQEIMKRMSLQNMGPSESKELQGLIDGTLGNNSSTGVSGSFNPVTSAKPQQKSPQQNNVASQFSRQEILDEINRRKNLKDITSNISQ